LKIKVKATGWSIRQLTLLWNFYSSSWIPTTLLVALLALAYWTLRPGGVGLPSLTKTSVLSNWTVPLLSSSLALGLVVMAIIQLFKPRLRGRFHWKELVLWFYGLWPQEEVSEQQASNAAAAYLHFLNPKVSAPVLELPLEQLTAQIQAALDAALVTETNNGAVRAIIYWLDREASGRHWDQDRPAEGEKIDGPRRQTLVGYLIQRKLDGFQIQVRYGWRKFLRNLSLLVSLFLTTMLAATLGLWDQNPLGTLFLVLLASVLASVFAAATRDLVAVIERFRN
jgi:hypothetical protein